MRVTISSSVDQHLTRFSHDLFLLSEPYADILQLFLPEKMRAKPIKKKLVKTPGVITNHCRSSVQWHARAKARLCLPLFTVFLHIPATFPIIIPGFFGNNIRSRGSQYGQWNSLARFTESSYYPKHNNCNGANTFMKSYS